MRRVLTPEEATARLENMRATIKAVIRQGGPTTAELAAAPMIDQFAVCDVGNGAQILSGAISGHPRLGDTIGRTSVVVVGGDGWVVTVGRIYRTGTPLPGQPEIRGVVGNLRSLAESHASLAATPEDEPPAMGMRH